MLIVIAIGGHALDPPGGGEGPQRMATLAASLAAAARDHRLVITHGSGPQIGDLALRAALAGQPIGLDRLCAELQGALGYRLSQSLAEQDAGPGTATVITRARVDPADPRLAHPDKPIGPVLDAATARDLAERFGWTMGQDRGGYRRLIASPLPLDILELEALRALVEAGVTVICAGGGGIPVARNADGVLTGLDAVIDKDYSAALIARALDAGALIFLTDVEAVRSDWPPPAGQWLRQTSPAALRALHFAVGSMRPKIEAAISFVEAGRDFAAIGLIEDLQALIARRAGTIVERDAVVPLTPLGDLAPTPPRGS